MSSLPKLYVPPPVGKNYKRSVVATMVRPHFYRVDMDARTYFDLDVKPGVVRAASEFFPGDDTKKKLSAWIVGPANQRKKPRADGEGWEVRYSFNIQLKLSS